MCPVRIVRIVRSVRPASPAVSAPRYVPRRHAGFDHARPARRAQHCKTDVRQAMARFSNLSARRLVLGEAQKLSAYAIRLRQGYGGQERFGKRRVAPAGKWSAVGLRPLEPPAPRQRARCVIPRTTFGRSSPPSEAGATFRSGTLPPQKVFPSPFAEIPPFFSYRFGSRSLTAL